MKKTLAILLLLAMALTLTACGNKTEEKTEAAVSQAPAEAPAAAAKTLQELADSVLSDAADLAPFSAEELQDMTGIAPEDCADFVFLQGNGMDGREILVIRAKDEAAADRVAKQLEEYLERRKEEHRDYAPDAYKLLSDAAVQRKGLLLAVVSGSDAAAESAALLAGE